MQRDSGHSNKMTPVGKWPFLEQPVTLLRRLLSHETKARGFSTQCTKKGSKNIVLANINHALFIYAASDSHFTPVQCFLARCFKRKYTSKPVNVYDLLERQDRKTFRKVVPNSTGHALLSYEKKLIFNLRLILCVLNTLSLTI